MICDSCEKEMLDGEAVRMEQDGEIVEGKFEPVDSPQVRHDECPSLMDGE